MKRLFIISVLCTLLGLTKTMAQEAYTVYDGTSKLTFYYDQKKSSRYGTKYSLNKEYESPGWSSIANNITTVVFDPSFAGARPTVTKSWFSGMRTLTTITGMEYLNTSEVTHMSDMFNFCMELRSLDLSHFNTAKVKNTYQMFYGCYHLATICVGDGWNMENITPGASIDMFLGCHKLVGGNGTKYFDMATSCTVALIDGQNDRSGYLTSAEYASKTYNLWVGGIQVTYLNKDDVFRDRRTFVSYDPTTKTLEIGGLAGGARIYGKGTSTDATTGYGAGIYSEIDGLTINVDETSYVNGLSGCDGIMLNNNTTITGSARLIVSGYTGISISSSQASSLTIGGNVWVVADGTDSYGMDGFWRARAGNTRYYTNLIVNDNATLEVTGRNGYPSIGYWANMQLNNGIRISSPDGATWDADKHTVCNTTGEDVTGRAVYIRYKTPDPADVNKDGTVDSADIVAVIKAMK